MLKFTNLILKILSKPFPAVRAGICETINSPVLGETVFSLGGNFLTTNTEEKCLKLGSILLAFPKCVTIIV